jgi:hypothetical protein
VVIFVRGKPWSADEVRQLISLWQAGKSVDEIASIMGKTRVAIKGKLFNSGLNSLVVATGAQIGVATTTATTTSPAVPVDGSLSVPPSAAAPGASDSAATLAERVVRVEGVDLRLPERLPSVEEELKVLSAAIEALKQPGLGRAEVSRLRNVILGVKVYQELYAKYVGYRELENEVLELKRKFASQNTQGSKEESSGVSS